MLNEKMYLLVLDGCIDTDYGSRMYVVGLYKTWDEAVEVKASFEPALCNNMNIIELEVGKTLDVKESYGDYETEKYIGGFAE